MANQRGQIVGRICEVRHLRDRRDSAWVGATAAIAGASVRDDAYDALGRAVSRFRRLC